MSEFNPKSFLKGLSGLPGVYQMLDETAAVLYVGKAKHLKNRLSSYFNGQSKSLKTQALVSKIDQIQVTVTDTEVEALLLEQNLIKSHRPPYNILLRDDKSYPFIKISCNHDYPRLSFFRGKARGGEGVYGPYPSSSSVKESLSLLQKVFKVRQCEDSYFKNRDRPCLEYQINRCSGPCVRKISEQAYAQDIEHVKLFLQGKNNALTETLTKEMEEASTALEFERAAQLRDQIQALRHVQASQIVSNSKGDVDVIAVYVEQGLFAVQLLVIRDGNMMGGRAFVPNTPEIVSEQVVLEAFLPQYYTRSELVGGLPSEVIVSHEITETEVFEKLFSALYDKKIKLCSVVRSQRNAWLEMAKKNAVQHVQSRLIHRKSYVKRFDDLNKWLGLHTAVPKTVNRIECVDISHTQGKDALGAFVVFNSLGALKSDYRKYNIRSNDTGDDVRSMFESINRRFKQHEKGEGACPELLLIDGGKTQLAQAAEVLLSLALTHIIVLGIAKGPTRKAGFENFFMVDFVANKEGEAVDTKYHIRQIKPPGTDSQAQYLLQEVRDEAHRFAITGHRNKRKKQLLTSTLESIPGVGAARRKNLLNHFGGLQGIKQASAEDISKVKGISKELANIIIDFLR